MKTILVADDEFDLLSSIQAILELNGYNVVTCADGNQALVSMNKNKPDLLITDVMMPCLSGFEVLAAMKKSADLSDIPAIVISCVQPSVAQKDYGWKAFVAKPFTIDELMVAVVSVIGA